MHPYIAPYGELKERSAKLNKSDCTAYDWELIARIPDMLHDKWDVAGKKYRIIQTNADI